ncbi:MAG: acyl-CoA dehydrogenase family protein, partial [Acidobacteria bacterium]|nr:acyl-CoA dehydrogenase family protein [Acidobacteriota bacterium]
QDTIAEGRFLTQSVEPSEVFTRDELSEEQRLFGQTAAEFMRQEVLPHQARLDAHDWNLTRDLLKKAAELDLLRLEIPPAYGGLGLDLISAAYVGEQIAIYPGFGGSIGAHTSIGTLPIVYFGNEDQKARYLPRLSNAELIGAYALTEPQAGSDALAARTDARLTPDGRHYVLNGQKAWITNGGFADLFTIFAKVDGEKFTAFLVERRMGVRSGPDEKKLGLDGSSTTALMLDEVKVPVENVLGTIGEGHKVAFNILNLGRVKLGARNIAGARQALDRATAYSKERRQFGRAICEFGLVKQKLAEMAIRCFVGEAMVYRTLGDVDRALELVDRSDGTRVLKTIEAFAVECSINKVWTSEALAYAVDEAVQVYGGNGYSREFPVECAYRDARITRIYEGTNEINRLIIPTRLLKFAAPLFTRDRAAHALLEKDSGPSPGPLSAERGLLGRAKRLALATLGLAAASFGDDLKHEQEVLGHAADILMEIYAIESVLARAGKLAGGRDDTRAAMGIDIARVFTADAVDRIAHSVRPVLGALAARGAAASLGDAVSQFSSWLPPSPFDDAQSAPSVSRGAGGRCAFDTIAARRRIAEEVIRVGRYPF